MEVVQAGTRDSSPMARNDGEGEAGDGRGCMTMRNIGTEEEAETLGGMTAVVAGEINFCAGRQNPPGEVMD